MNEINSNPDRRSFLKAAAAAGILSAAAPAKPQTQEGAVTGPTQEPPKPPGMLDLLDLRYPVSYQESIPSSVKVLTDYFAALSRRDLDGMAEMCQFPFASFEGPTVVEVKSKDDLMVHTPASMGMSLHPVRWSGNNDSYLQPGCYDIFAGMQVLVCNPVCATMALDYYRYDGNGKPLLKCEGVYIATNNDGKWGIEVMSTIFTPSDIALKRYPISEHQGEWMRIIHDIGPNVQDSDDDNWDYQWGPSVGLNIGGGGMFGIKRPNEDVMASFKTAGVKSRLRISDEKPTPSAINPDARLNIMRDGGNTNNPADVAKYKDDWSWYREMFRSSGLGEVGIVEGILPYTRVVHAGNDKAHVLTGITRYTCSGEVFNSQAEIDIVTWINGRWGVASFAGRVTMQNRVNDIRKA